MTQKLDSVTSLLQPVFKALPALPSSLPPSPLLSRFLSCDLIRLIPVPGPLHFLPGQLLHGFSHPDVGFHASSIKPPQPALPKQPPSP